MKNPNYNDNIARRWGLFFIASFLNYDALCIITVIIKTFCRKQKIVRNVLAGLDTFLDRLYIGHGPRIIYYSYW